MPAALTTAPDPRAGGRGDERDRGDEGGRRGAEEDVEAARQPKVRGEGLAHPLGSGELSGGPVAWTFHVGKYVSYFPIWQVTDQGLTAHVVADADDPGRATSR